LNLNRHRGFNFIEVLFAVILLGLGFIMIAGVFPVAIQQNAATANETTGALVARDAIRSIQAIADTSGPVIASQTANQLFPSTMVGAVPGVAPFTGVMMPATPPGLMNAIGSSCYSTADRRFGWVGFYRRDSATDPFVQVFVIVLQNQNFADSSYALYGYPPPIPSVANVAFPVTAPPVPGNVIAPVSPPALPPTQLAAEFGYSVITGNSYAFIFNNAATNPLVTNAVNGAFVLVAAGPDNLTPAIAPPAVPNNARAAGELTGKIVRLGTQITTAQLPPDVRSPKADTNPPPGNFLTFILQPGSDLKDLGEETVGASSTTNVAQQLPVYIIGAAPDPNTGAFTGPNQDITAVSAYIRLNTSN
jgi:Tfp pilus assembly protein PilV